MQFLVLIATVVVALLALFVFIGDFGYIQIRWGQWQLESTLGTLTVALLAGLGILGVMWKIISYPIVWRHNYLSDRSQRHARVFTNCLVRYLNGELMDADKELQTLQKGTFALPSILLQAWIKQQQGQFVEREKKIHQALKQHVHSKEIIQLVEALCLEQHKAIEPALQITTLLLERGSASVSAWRLLSRLLKEGERWSALERVLKDTQIRVPKAEKRSLSAAVLKQKMNVANTAAELDKVWKESDSSLHYDLEVLQVAVDKGTNLQWEKDYVALIQLAWKRSKDSRLLELLMRVPISDPHKVLQWVERAVNVQDTQCVITYRQLCICLAIQAGLIGLAEETLRMLQKDSQHVMQWLPLSLALAFEQNEPNQAKQYLYTALASWYPNILSK